MRTKLFTYTFVFFIIYQYLMSMLFLNHTMFYTIINPYTLFSLFSFILLIQLLAKKVLNKILLVILFLFLFIGFIAFFKYHQYSVFPFNFIKSLQYFYGIVLVTLGIYFILQTNKRGYLNYFLLYKNIIKTVLIITSIVTIGEFIYHNILRLPWEYLGNIPSVKNEYNPSRLIAMRPFGITSYPQPNGVILAILIYLHYLVEKKIDKFFFLGSLALLLSMTGTGILIWLLLIPLLFKNTLKISILAISALIALSVTLVKISTYFPNFFIFKRLSVEQFQLYFQIFIKATFDKYIKFFDTYQIWWGANVPNFNVGTGITHDWGYFDVFYEYGNVGLAIYIIIYSLIIYNSINIFTLKNKKIYFTIVILISNLHYPTINFYVGQFIFGILFSINIFLKRNKHGKN